MFEADEEFPFNNSVALPRENAAIALFALIVLISGGSCLGHAQESILLDATASGRTPMISLRTNMSRDGKAGTTEHRIFGPYNDPAGDAGALFIGAGQTPSGGQKNDIILYNVACTGGCNVPQIFLYADTTHLTGNIQVDGNIVAKYQDLAEWVVAEKPLPSGTVVVLDKTHANRVTASRTRYDTAVAGVVSETPGLLLGEKGADKLKVATTGRVKVRVDAQGGAISIGDLLVTSEVEGVAMKSQPVEVAGIQMHRPGTLIGKALEPLNSGRGEITVLLSLQ